MKTVKTISVLQFCEFHNIPKSFIISLSEFELIALIKKENKQYIKERELATVERLMRLHFELDVNFEGLDVINNLMEQINTLQKTLQEAQNKIDFYN